MRQVLTMIFVEDGAEVRKGFRVPRVPQSGQLQPDSCVYSRRHVWVQLASCGPTSHRSHSSSLVGRPNASLQLSNQRYLDRVLDKVAEGGAADNSRLIGKHGPGATLAIPHRHRLPPAATPQGFSPAHLAAIAAASPLAAASAPPSGQASTAGTLSGSWTTRGRCDVTVYPLTVTVCPLNVTVYPLNVLGLLDDVRQVTARPGGRARRPPWQPRPPPAGGGASERLAMRLSGSACVGGGGGGADPNRHHAPVWARDDVLTMTSSPSRRRLASGRSRRGPGPPTPPRPWSTTARRTGPSRRARACGAGEWCAGEWCAGGARGALEDGIEKVDPPRGGVDQVRPFGRLVLCHLCAVASQWALLFHNNSSQARIKSGRPPRHAQQRGAGAAVFGPRPAQLLCCSSAGITS
jgi:hypothetical protein